MKLDRHVERLRKELRVYTRPSQPHRLALPGQPFDSHYLKLSRLFAYSRKEFLRGGGRFISELTTTPRSLSSAVLLTNTISYSPIESELLWTASDPAQSRDDSALLRLISYSTSLFHEQNHRILWKRLPKPRDLSTEGLRRYLNFVESLVVTLDAMLGDSLGIEASRLAYLSGVLYDPGTKITFTDEREKLNYYHAHLRACYYALEGYERERILSAIPALHRELTRRLSEHATERALRLDEKFIQYTNPVWQKMNQAAVKKAFASGKSDEKRLAISRDPVDFIEPYLWAEKILVLYAGQI